MDYYGGRIWYAQGRIYSAGDIVGGASGTAPNNYRDAVIKVTENPLAFGGDGFTVPTNAGNIRALKHSASLNAPNGEGQFFIFTRNSIYMLQVPNSRFDWISAENDGTNGDSGSMPMQTVIQMVNGATSDRSIVSVNGDLFYQSFDPAIRSLITATRYFQQWGNTPISKNEQRALALNDRALMRFSGGIHFDGRMLQAVMPRLAADGINVVHDAILPLDFEDVSNLPQDSTAPAWEGAYDGLQHLQLFEGDFGGLPRAFSGNISILSNAIELWELSTANKTEESDRRIVWSPEFPAFTWANENLEFKLKQLKGGELWVDRLSGTVDVSVYYREDAAPCWQLWLNTSICAGRCEDVDTYSSAYPCAPFREGYVFPVVFPEPPSRCGSMGVRPSTIGYQFQVKIMLKGYCRIRGLILYATPHAELPYRGIACPATGIPQGMAQLPSPF
jgi:hypothetical protein